MNTVDKHALPVGRLRAWGHTEGTLSLSPVFEPGLCDINSCVFKTNCYSVCAQSCPTLCDPLDCSPPGSSVHGILQARLLEWVAIYFSRGSSQPRDQTQVSCIAGKRFNLSATREAPQVSLPVAECHPS